MENEEIQGRKKRFIQSYVGLFFGWLGILVIAAGVALGLRELRVYGASWSEMIYWAKIAGAGTAAIYAMVMFALSWSFARSIGIQFLPAMAFAIWGMIPIVNLIPVVILAILAGPRRELFKKRPRSSAPSSSSTAPGA